MRRDDCVAVDSHTPKSSPLLITLLTTSVVTGLFTVSWDKFLAFRFLGYNIKLASVMFTLSVIVSVILTFRRLGNATQFRAAWALILLMFTVLSVASAFSANPASGFVQEFSWVVGAVFPFFSILTLAGLAHDRVFYLVSAFVYGGLFAAAHGIYQYLATIIGWPQIVEYFDTAGGLPRISSFSYESGYFGYYMILVLGALPALHLMRPRAWHKLAFLFVVGTLFLANTRASILTLPILIFFLGVSFGFRNIWRLSSKYFKFPNFILFMSGALALLSGALVFGQQYVIPYFGHIATIFDPSEPSSNSPRIQLFAHAWNVVEGNLWIGIGPGNLIEHIEQYLGQDVSTLTSNQIVANNAYLQALLDGGIPFLILVIGWVVYMVKSAFFEGTATSKYLMSGWISVVSISFIGVSYFWDPKLWVVAALSLSAAKYVSSNPRKHDVSEFIQGKGV